MSTNNILVSEFCWRLMVILWGTLSRSKLNVNVELKVTKNTESIVLGISKIDKMIEIFIVLEKT